MYFCTIFTVFVCLYRRFCILCYNKILTFGKKSVIINVLGVKILPLINIIKTSPLPLKKQGLFLFFFFQSEHHSENTFKEFRTFDYKNFHRFPPYRFIRIAPDTTSNTDVITTIHLAGNIHIRTIPNPRATKQIPMRQMFLLLRFKSIPPRNDRSLHYTEKIIFLCMSRGVSDSAIYFVKLKQT